MIMTATIVTVSLTLALSSFGLGHDEADHHHPHHIKTDHIVPPGPGDGWGFPNGNPDKYGWVDYGVDLPLGSDRTAEYFFPRYFAAPPDQMFIQTYYNPFETRGQRYIPFVGAAEGEHPAGGPPVTSAALPVSPYAEESDTPVVRIPRLNGRVEGPAPAGSSGLNP
jgi:hypothetical protein